MDSSVLLKKYFDENNIVESNIAAFNFFIENGMQVVIEENKEAEPSIIPQNIEKFQIRFGRISVGKPEIIEADGSKRPIFPMEARLRKLSYHAPIFLEISTYINDVQRENFVAEIGKLPIMLKSKYCNLSGLNREDLIKKGEDPDDPGGYFIINGTERVVVSLEDLAGNNMIIEKDKKYNGVVGKFYASAGAYKIPHVFEKKKDGVIYITFTRVKSIPVTILLKALGMLKDEDIMKNISQDAQYDEVLLNLYEFMSIDNQEDAIDYIGKKLNPGQPKDIRIERTKDLIDNFFLPHLGKTHRDRNAKAINLCKLINRLLIYYKNGISDDKDHYKNKRVRTSGDLLLDLFRANFTALVNDILYNFQRIIKRGKLPSVKVIIRDKLLTNKIYGAMATGEWVGGRQGVSQRLDRNNYMMMLSNLQRVVSPLSSNQENFEARAVHCTHQGRLCPIETPEGPPIGLRKNLAMLCSLSQTSEEKKVLDVLSSLGLKK